MPPHGSALPRAGYQQVFQVQNKDFNMGTLVRAETAQAEAEAPTPTGSTPLNIYGEQLQGCDGPDDLCEYTSDIPTLCVRTGKIDMRYECKSIWTAEWKPFRFFEGDGQAPRAGDTTKCEAVPAEVLDSEYSLENWKSIWMTVAKPGESFVDKERKWSKEPKISRKGREFRKSIDFICQTCPLFTESDSAKGALRSKCEAIGWTPDSYIDSPPSKK
jgi:hypothetical protein